MASFEKRGKTWRYVISYKDDLGQNKRIQKGGFNTKREAQMHANDLEYNLKRGYDISNDVIFVEYFKQWYEINKKPHVSYSTLKRYISAYNYLKEYFNNKRIKDIKQSDYQ
ncbi:Arm DNA-binding domain-containing protein [Staphylococcus nepalensis]|uniref:Arm DNA-binding domain-containing protein n=1 Tax=Staphylococcus nepalensis TaxID=214473 RepID=UPI001F62341D|nr:Arm DNA-binding domain-containing protein [Staphylococcus nepalensis]